MFQSPAIEFIALYNPIVLHFDYSYIFSSPTFLKWRFSDHIFFPFSISGLGTRESGEGLALD